MLRFMSFSSGSCGNCYFLGTGKGAILIDAGVSLKRLRSALRDYELTFDSFSDILVTHDHLDHIRHLGSYCKRLHKNVHTSTRIHDALARHTFTKDYIGSCRRDIPDGDQVEIGGFRVRYFVVPHDATQTVGYAVEIPAEMQTAMKPGQEPVDRKFVIMTDIGHMTDEAVEYARQADTVVLESNYDIDMLMQGPYTHELKMRIVQGCGHLSNDEAASAIRRIWHPGLKNLFLCHLSENNNTPDLAFESAKAALRDCGAPEGSVNLRCLPRTYPSALFSL